MGVWVDGVRELIGIEASTRLKLSLLDLGIAESGSGSGS